MFNFLGKLMAFLPGFEFMTHSFGGGSSSSSSSGGGVDAPQVDFASIIEQYGYPTAAIRQQMVDETQKTGTSLFDVTQSLLSGDVNKLPYGLGSPTTGLYEAATRDIQRQFLGEGGKGVGGLMGDIQQQLVNAGLPEYAPIQQRQAANVFSQDLLDTAATLNENEKLRLERLLGLGAEIGGNLYSQNLNQFRFNSGTAADVATANANRAMQASYYNAMLAPQESGSNFWSTLGQVGGTVLGAMGGGGTGGATTFGLFGGAPSSQDYSNFMTPLSGFSSPNVGKTVKVV